MHTSGMENADPAGVHGVGEDANGGELKFVGEREESGGVASSGVAPGDTFPQHEECVAILTMKCGEPLMAVRKKLHDEIAITFIPEEGFGVFQSKVERHYGKLGPNYIQERRAIYLKPSSNATQSKYVLLTHENFDMLLRGRWKVARSMKVDLKYEVFCYFVDMTSKKEKKRLSMKMYQQQQQQQQQLVAAASSDASANVEPLVANGAAVPSSSTAANPSSFLPFSQPSNANFTLMQNYPDLGMVNDPALASASGKIAKPSHKSSTRDDSSTSERPRKIARSKHAPTASSSEPQLLETTEEPVFHTLPFRINGFVVPLEVDITALRRSLGLIPPSPDVPTGGGASTASGNGSLDPSSHL